MDVHEYLYWNKMSYGRAVRLRRRWLRKAFLLFCMITPMTNWLIPFTKRIIRNSYVIRFEIIRA